MRALLACCAFFLFGSGVSSRGEAVTLARDGKALMPVVISRDAPEEIRQLAGQLAAGLGRMSGGAFEVVVGGTSGIIVGTGEEWPGVLKPPAGGNAALLTREEYLLKSGEGRLLVIGRTPLATQDAVWDLLHRLGFRQFFPGEKWEIWPPRVPTLEMALDTFQAPSYFTRKFFFPGNTSRQGRADFRQWQIRNRLVSGFNLETGHAYDAIINRNREHFALHPQDIARREPGVPQKLDPSRPTVLEVAAADALRQLAANPAMDTVRMDPSDGGGWRTDSPLGAPSNQAVTLANHVAREIQGRFPGVKVGIYAYNQHSPPPEIEVDPNVIVSIATSFLSGGYSVEQLMKAWRAKGAEIGIREYLSVWSWEKDMPGRSRASDLDYLFSTIVRFHELGARYWITEASHNWASHGLGYYLASRLLWDTGEAAHREALVEDFFQRSFGAAASEMKGFYQHLLLESKPLLSDDLLGRMYRALQRAHLKADSPEVSARIDDLVIYTRFVDLMFAYRNAKGNGRQAAYEALADFAIRAQSSHMVNTLAIVRTMVKKERGITAVTRWQDLERGAVSRRSPLTGAELAQIVRHGVETKALNDFQPVAYGTELLPPPEPEGDGPEEAAPVGLRGESTLYVFMEPGKNAIRFQARAGLIYKGKGAAQFRLYSDQHALVNEPVASAEVPPDGVLHDVELPSPYGGLHRLELSDKGALTELSWPRSQRVAFPVSPDQRAVPWGNYEMVFYVPKGVKVVGGYSEAAVGRVELADGREVFNFRSMGQAGYFSIPVPEGSAGAWWRLKEARGAKLLLTVPPYLFRTLSERMIPTGAE